MKTPAPEVSAAELSVDGPVVDDRAEAVHGLGPVPTRSAERQHRRQRRRSSAQHAIASRLLRIGGALVGVGLLVGVWSLVYALQWFPANLFPSVGEILRAGRDLWTEGVLRADIVASVKRAISGFAIGTAVGVAVALVTATTKAGRFVVQPILRLLAPIPTIGLVPLAILWFGIGETSKVVVVALGVFVPVWINSHAGLATTPVDYLRVSRCLGASRLLTLRRVVFPEAFPDIVAGMRVGGAMAFVLIVVAEMTGTTNGLGYRIYQAQLFSQADRLIFCLLVLGLIGALFDQLIALGARRFTRWASEEH